VSRIFVHGIGCVSPTGWGVPRLREALLRGDALATSNLRRPGSKRPLHHRAVPPAPAKLPFMTHPRLRRSSPLTVYGAAAALEALGTQDKKKRLGVLFCVTGGCVQFSRRFYDETWRDPSKASPLIFPETVFNAPSSHLSAVLESPQVNYTLLGDPSTVLQAMATAADWLTDGKVDQCLVIGAEESDWLLSDAYRLFSRQTICAEGAGAILLSTERSDVELAKITDAYLYWTVREQPHALKQVRAALSGNDDHALLCDSQSGATVRDRPEVEAWADWAGKRISPKKILGEGLAAGAAWQCVAAIDALRNEGHESALISVAGTHEHAIGARFVRATLEK
jgi:3-oxoacyl-(acyl-carrier-protein) synthase